MYSDNHLWSPIYVTIYYTIYHNKAIVISNLIIIFIWEYDECMLRITQLVWKCNNTYKPNFVQFEFSPSNWAFKTLYYNILYEYMGLHWTFHAQFVGSHYEKNNYNSRSHQAPQTKILIVNPNVVKCWEKLCFLCLIKS